MQDTVDSKVIHFFIRVFSVVVVDVGLLFVPHTDSLLLIANCSSSASAATDVLWLTESVSRDGHLVIMTVENRGQGCAGKE